MRTQNVRSIGRRRYRGARPARDRRRPATSRTTRALHGCLGFGVLSLLVAGCAAGGTVHRAGGVTAMVAGGPPVAVMEALISGTLTQTDEGCLAVTAGGVAYPLQFPFGTRLSDDGTEIAVPGISPLRIGDEVSGGGGYTHLSDVDRACIADNEHDEYALWQTVAG